MVLCTMAVTPGEGSAWEEKSIETQAVTQLRETWHGLLPHKFI